MRRMEASVPAWFSDARLGIFLHWGIYAVGQYPESWSFFNHGAPGSDPSDTLSHEDYYSQAKAFLARRYDPEAWADLFVEAGARYAVLTSKHHDGMALWDTADGLSVVRDTPAGRDLVGPFCQALRSRGIKVGLYFSHLDWHHPDYPSLYRGDQPPDRSHPGHRYAYAQGEPDPARWESFLKFHRRQLKELCERYAPDLLWFDGDWEREPDQWRFAELRQELKAMLPDVVLNSRMGGYGDYATPEQGVPIARPQGAWELCLTMNRSWSQATDPSYKSVPELVRILAECAGMGGNFLLNLAPMSDGTIFYKQQRILREIGAWLTVNAEAVYSTEAGLPHGHWYGPSTLSKDKRSLYLFQFDKPQNEVGVKGIRNKVLAATVLGCPEAKISVRVSGGAPWMRIPGITWLGVPSESIAPMGSVIKLVLDGPLDLYTGAGAAIEQN